VVPEHAEELRALGAFLDDGLSWEWSSAGEQTIVPVAQAVVDLGHGDEVAHQNSRQRISTL
jgi:hypothetical protein